MVNIEEIKEYITNNYCEQDLENNHHDYDNNPRLDDCFSGGYDKGYAKAMLEIGKLLGLSLPAPEDTDD